MSNIECSICNRNLTEDDEVNATGCGHMFHYYCLRRCMDDSETCPQCGQNVSRGDIQRVQIGSSSRRCTNRRTSRNADSQEHGSEEREPSPPLRIYSSRSSYPISRREELEIGRGNIVNRDGNVIICDTYNPRNFRLNLALNLPFSGRGQLSLDSASPRPSLPPPDAN